MAHRALAIFRRRLITYTTALSLLLFLATLALWVRSYWRFDLLSRSSRTPTDLHVLGVHSGSGLLGAQSLYLDAPYRPAFKWGYNTNSEPDRFSVTQPDASFLGFGYYYARKGTPDTGRFVWFPHWFPALLFAVLPALRLRSILRTRRCLNRAGVCPYCGYDLRATPNRCPECGRVPGGLASGY